MACFNNEQYQILANDLIGDIFYTSTSYRGKISTLRQYAEIIIRKILDINPKEKIMLGDKKIRKHIETLQNHEVVENAVKKLKEEGNKTTHTQYRGEVTDKEFNIAMDGIFDLLSYLFINYFEKYEFGTNTEVMYSFSILPPIIRYKVLIFLYGKYPENRCIIDKLVLATLKACDVQTAEKWVEDNKESLMLISAYSENFNNNIELQYLISKKDVEINMYHLCKKKVNQVGEMINRSGVLYSDFESALPHYRKNGIIQDNTLEAQEFNDIMEFIYMGRKERERLCSALNNPMLILNIIE